MSAQYFLQFIVNKGNSVLPPKPYQIELTKYILVPTTNLMKLSSFTSFIKHHMDMLSAKAISSSHNAFPILLDLKVTPLTNLSFCSFKAPAN